MKIVVYSKPDCMQCDFTKKYLEEAGVGFETKDVSASPEALAELKSMNFMSVPVVVAEGFEAFSGFRIDVLEKIVKEA